MAKVKVADIRNIAFCGHGSAGKTTLVDKILVKTGAVSSNPSVDDGTSICDFDQEEKDHKYSIEASVVHCNHAGKRFNLIDTPGYPDFVGQAIGHVILLWVLCGKEQGSRGAGVIAPLLIISFDRLVDGVTQ